MKNVKKTIALILILCMALSMAGCSRPITKEERENVGVGTTKNGVYENAFYDIGFTAPEGWTCRTQEEVWAQNGWSTDKDLQKQLEDRLAKNGHFIDMMASKGKELTVKVSIDNAAVMQDPDISEEDYARATRVDAEEQLGDAGCSDLLVKDIQEPFFGEKHYGFHIAANLNGTMMYQKEIYIKNGIYFVVITTSSTGVDKTDELMHLFYKLSAQDVGDGKLQEVEAGSVTDGVYENTFYGIGFAVPEEWVGLTQEEIWAENGWSTEKDAQEQMMERLAVHGHFVDMMASKGDELTVKVSVDSAAVLDDADISEEDYADAARVDAEEQLRAAGCEDLQAEGILEDFLSRKHYGYHIAAEENGTMMYRKAIYIKHGVYFVVVTVSSSGEDRTDELLEMFYKP